MSSYVGWKRGLVVFIFMCGLAHLCEAESNKKVGVWAVHDWVNGEIANVMTTIGGKIKVDINDYDVVGGLVGKIVGKGGTAGVDPKSAPSSEEVKGYVRDSIEDSSRNGARILLKSILLGEPEKVTTLKNAVTAMDFLVFTLFSSFGSVELGGMCINIPDSVISISVYNFFDTYVKTLKDDNRLYVKYESPDAGKYVNTREILINFRKENAAHAAIRYRYFGVDNVKGLYLFLNNYKVGYESDFTPMHTLSLIFTDAQSLKNNKSIGEMFKSPIGIYDCQTRKQYKLTLDYLLDVGAKLLNKDKGGALEVGGLSLWQIINKMNYLLSNWTDLDKKVFKKEFEQLSDIVLKINKDKKFSIIKEYLKKKMNSLNEKVNEAGETEDDVDMN